MTKTEAKEFQRKLLDLTQFDVDDLYNLRRSLRDYAYGNYCSLSRYQSIKDDIDEEILGKLEKYDGTG